MPASAVLLLFALPLGSPPEELVELAAKAASKGSLTQGTIDTLRFHAWSAERWRHEDPTFARIMRQRGISLAAEAARGRDPFVTTTGIVYRAMQSPFAPGGLRPYGLYVPRSYDPSRRYPLFVLLRGGTSDHMSLLRQMLGYPNGAGETKALIARRPIASSRLPDLGWLVATPSGYGNTAFAGIGEEEVLEVIDDVVRSYSVDPDRIVLAGVSRGGYAAVDLGVRYAGRFAAVVDICGFADPVIQKQRNLRERPLRGFERRLLSMVRPIELAERTAATPFYFVVGGRDPGTWPAGLRMLARRLDAVGGGHTWLEWPNAYHSVWVPAFRDGTILKRLDADGVRRDSRPAKVVLVAGQYRDAEQRWVRVEQMERFGSPARVEASVAEGGHRIVVRTENVEALRLALDEAPCDGDVEVVVDGHLAYSGPARAVVLVEDAGGQFAERRWTPPSPGLRKVRGSSGPLEDRDHALTAYVYGTGRPRSTPALRDAAERAARGGFGNGGAIWRQGPVLADVDYDPARLPPHHLALYGHAGENSWTARVAPGLPIRVGDGFVELRGARLDRPGDGVRMVHPNPLDPARYVEVVAAVDADDVFRAVKLPDLLPDYVVFSRSTFVPTWQHLLHVRAGFHEAGFFDELWRLVPDIALGRSRPGGGMEALP
ncbi:MAG: prolyl oligopeptidase family serine peptidase [Deltaproteobacteria bacterium]|nr:prolyl oligopeptidase family serine peptidase [Deltaproteobacteria bacterium]